MEPPSSASASAKSITDRRVRSLNRLFELTTSMLNIEEVGPFLQSLAETVSEIFGFEHVSISTFEEELGKFYHHGLAGYTDEEKAFLRSDPEALSVEEILTDFREDCKLSNIVYFIPFEKQQSPMSDFVMVRDQEAAAEPRKSPDTWHQLDLMYFQLKNRKGDMIGYMQVDYPKDGKIPKADSVKEMELFANLAAVAIDNAKMFQRTRAYLDLLSHDVGNLITPVGIYLDVVMNTQGITPLQKKYLSSASEAAKTITKLVGDVRSSALLATTAAPEGEHKGVGRLVKETPSGIVMSSTRSDEFLTLYMMDILAGILKVEPLDVLLHKIARVISENFKMNRVIVGVRDERTGEFCEKVLYGYPVEDAMSIKKRSYTLERMKYDLREEFKIGDNAYYVRPIETGVVHKDDHMYSVHPEHDYVHRATVQDWQQLDYIDFVMTDRSDNWIGWIEIDDPADGKVPSKEVIERIRVLSDLAAIAIENSGLYEKAVSTANEATSYLDMIVRGIGNKTEAISGFYSSMSGIQMNPEQTEALRNARQAAESITEIVQDVRKFTEIRDAAEQPVKEILLKDLIEDSVRRTRFEFPGKETDLVLRIDDEEAAFMGDKYANDLFLGLLEHVVARDRNPKTVVEIEVEDAKDSWRVLIHDRGPAISSAQMESMFKMLSGRRGRALGKETALAITVLLVERYRGTIGVRERVKGEPDKGATFEISLPKSIPLLDWMRTYPQSKKKGAGKAPA